MYFRIVAYYLISLLMSVSLCYADGQNLDLDQTSSEPPPTLQFSNVEFRITGTSNVRDWDIVSDTMGGIIRFGSAFTHPEENSGNPGAWIEEVFLYIPNHSLDSGNPIMNQTMNNSLESESYPNLEYRMSDVEDMSAGSSSDELSFIVNGVLGAAGAEYELTHEVFVHQISEKTFRIFGDFEMNMTDLDIEPPTFMRGALKTTDAVEVNYNLTVTLED